MEFAAKLMLRLLRAGSDADVAELRKWLIQIFSYETATDLGHTVSEWIDHQGGWVRIYMFKNVYNSTTKIIFQNYFFKNL